MGPESAALLSSRSLKSSVLGCALLAPALLAGCDRQSTENTQPQAEQSAAGNLASKLDRLHKGEPLPDITLTDANGKEVALPTLKGQPLLINLWATWCAPCKAEMPTLDDVAAAKAGTLRVLAVSQDNQPEEAREFLKEHGFRHLEGWFDPQANLTFGLGASVLPTTILYDAQGNEVWRYTGENDWMSEAAAKLLAESDS